MLELKNISVFFGDVEILKDISFVVRQNDIVAIMGHNGAGKSTLFDVIAGRIKPKTGQVLFDSEDITGLSEKDRAPMIGRLLQNVNLGSVANMTVFENLALAMLKGKTATVKSGLSTISKQVAYDLLKQLDVNLESKLDVLMGSLSGGQRQMIAFLMSTLVKPRILLLDEPTAALDPVAAEQLLTFAKAYVVEHQIPTLLITHDREVAEKTGTERWELSRERGLTVVPAL